MFNQIKRYFFVWKSALNIKKLIKPSLISHSIKFIYLIQTIGLPHLLKIKIFIFRIISILLIVFLYKLSYLLICSINSKIMQSLLWFSMRALYAKLVQGWYIDLSSKEFYLLFSSALKYILYLLLYVNCSNVRESQRIIHFIYTSWWYFIIILIL